MAMEQMQNISVIEPITPAIDRVKLMLFRPFDLVRWFTIGFCAWLAYLCQGGGHVNIPFDAFKKDRPWHHHDFGGFDNIAAQFTPVVIAIIIVVSVIAIAVGIVCLWLSSRGRFMFLHCVATNKAEVAVPWQKYSRQGNSLFVFRLVAGIIALMAAAAVAGGIALLGVFMYHSGAAIWAVVLSVVFIVLIMFLPAVIAIAIFFKFTNDFVVPIMFLRNATAIEGWREFLGMLSTNKGKFALYILFQIVIVIALGMLVSVFALTACCVCCCTACVWFIPYISTVVLLPVLAFKVGYAVCYLRQFGPAYDVFAVSA